MKIKNRSNKKKVLALLTIAIAVTLSLGAVSLYALKLGPFSKSKSPNSSETVNNSPSTSGKSTMESNNNTPSQTQGKSEEKTGSDPAPAPTPNPSGGKSTVDIEITAANQYDAILHIRTLIQYVTQNGQCSLSIKDSAGKNYTTSSNVQALPSSSTCKGFDVPISTLSKGSWHITLTFENDTVTGSASKEVIVQ